MTSQNTRTAIALSAVLAFPAAVWFGYHLLDHVFDPPAITITLQGANLMPITIDCSEACALEHHGADLTIVRKVTEQDVRDTIQIVPSAAAGPAAHGDVARILYETESDYVCDPSQAWCRAEMKYKEAQSK